MSNNWLYRTKNQKSFIQKARDLQNRFEICRTVKKRAKRQRYQAFLANPPRPLPPYNSLAKWRKSFIYVALICLAIPSFQTIFLYHTITDRLFQTTYPICGSFFLIFLSFGITFDWVIHRRWNDKKTIIPW